MALRRTSLGAPTAYQSQRWERRSSGRRPRVVRRPPKVGTADCRCAGLVSRCRPNGSCWHPMVFAAHFTLVYADGQPCGPVSCSSHISSSHQTWHVFGSRATAVKDEVRPATRLPNDIRCTRTAVGLLGLCRQQWHRLPGASASAAGSSGLWTAALERRIKRLAFLAAGACRRPSTIQLPVSLSVDPVSSVMPDLSQKRLGRVLSYWLITLTRDAMLSVIKSRIETRAQAVAHCPATGATPAADGSGSGSGACSVAPAAAGCRGRCPVCSCRSAATAPAAAAGAS